MKRPAIFLLDSRKFLIVYIIDAVKNAGCRHFSGANRIATRREGNV